MPYLPDAHHRRSIRLRHHNYSHAGAYFITICTQNRECLFSERPDSALKPNDAGEMVHRWYRELERKFPKVHCDAFVAMPNHVHFILVILDILGSPSLTTVVQWFKTMTTNGYIHGVKQFGWPSFANRLWQRNYYERAIRTEAELNQTREYIALNPANWHLDTDNPEMLS